MRPANLIFSAVQFLTVLVVLGTGIFFVGLPKAPHVRLALSDFFAQDRAVFSFAGYLILLIGAALLVGFCGLYRKPFLRLQMQAQPTSIDLKLVREYVESYWKKRFPHHTTSLEVYLSRKKKIEVIADFPTLEGKQFELSLQEIERELGLLFSRNLGYKGDFFVTLRYKTD